MRQVTITLPGWIRTEEAQEEVVRNLRTHALLKTEVYRSKMKLFEAKYGTTFTRFQRRVTKSSQEDFTAWDDLMEWETLRLEADRLIFRKAYTAVLLKGRGERISTLAELET